MRPILKILLSVCLLCAAWLAQGAHAWQPEVSVSAPPPTSLVSGCLVLDAPDTTLQEIQTAARLYQPPVTNDDRTEFFWAPETVLIDVVPALAQCPLPEPAPVNVWLRIPLRPPTLL